MSVDSIQTSLKNGLPIAATLAGSLAGIAALATFWWNSARLFARRQAAIDLATKQIAFWDQALKLELSATEFKQQEAKDRAYRAVERIRSEASIELTRVAWSRSIKQVMKSNPDRYLASTVAWAIYGAVQE